MTREGDWLAALPQDPVPGGFGIGDDTACLPDGTLATIDTLVEGVHFTPEEDPARVAVKLLGVNISDIAAMGGTPTWALLSLALAPGFVAEVFWYALRAACREKNIVLVGGDTVSSPATVLSLTLLGRIGSKPPRRNEACPGDILFVTGSLGGAVASGRHLSPPCRLAEGRWLADSGVRCLMDLSDGLALSLRTIAMASGVAIHCTGRDIPVHNDVPPGDPFARALAALGDGEDFELLGSVAPDLWTTLQQGSHPLYPVGEVRQGQGATWTPPGGDSEVALPEVGYEHVWKDE